MSEAEDKVLAEALRIMKERELLSERISRLEASRGEVSQAVFDRVYKEYSARMGDADERLKRVQGVLETERARLAKEKARLAGEVSTALEGREEIVLRHKIGEISEAEFTEREGHFSGQAQKLKAALEQVESSIKQYAAIFEGHTGSSKERECESDSFREHERVVRGKERVGERVVPPDYNDDFLSTGQGDYFEPSASSTGGRVVPPDYNDATDPRLEGLPAEPPRASLSANGASLVLFDEGKLLEKWPLKEEIFIGRAANNEVVLKEPKVSRRHATVEKREGNYWIKDLGSSNGTFVNGDKITERVLNDGDEVGVGDFRLIFKAGA